jgi:hypothetical protein
MFVPRSCWSWEGSVAMRAVRAPGECSSVSKKEIGFEIMFLKYSLRYVAVIF